LPSRLENPIGSTDPLGGHSKSLSMAKANQLRVELLQAVTKSVNKVSFNPSKARKDEAFKAIDSLREYVEKQSKPKVSKPKAKPEPKAKAEVDQNHLLEMFAEFMRQQQVVEESPKKPKATKKPKAKASKRKAKPTKRTPSEIVADSDEMKSRKIEVGVISKADKKTANVSEAAEKVASLGRHNADAKASKSVTKAELTTEFRRLKDESPEDAVRRLNELRKRAQLEAELLAEIGNEVVGQVEMNF
jgi:hypothetical protein